MSPLAFIARGTTHIPFPDLSAAMDQFLPFPASEDLLPSAVRTESPQRRCFFDPQVRVRGDFSDDRRKDAGGAVPDDPHSSTPRSRTPCGTRFGSLISYNESDPLLGVGAVDFAGSLAVLGPRKGRFYEDAGGRRCANDEKLR